MQSGFVQYFFLAFGCVTATFWLFLNFPLISLSSLFLSPLSPFFSFPFSLSPFFSFSFPSFPFIVSFFPSTPFIFFSFPLFPLYCLFPSLLYFLFPLLPFFSFFPFLLFTPSFPPPFSFLFLIPFFSSKFGKNDKILWLFLFFIFLVVRSYSVFLKNLFQDKMNSNSSPSIWYLKFRTSQHKFEFGTVRTSLVETATYVSVCKEHHPENTISASKRYARVIRSVSANELRKRFQ